ncbi:MAG: hypothetical protein M0P71_00900 [Melioribacteraceae bacterium]|nr:hypothetical protein [Melioribacteraceae bacterium]
METIFKTIYGSRLYGTNTNDSDTDIKSIIAPDIKNLILEEKIDIINGKTGNNDVGEMTIQDFRKFLTEGKVISLDLLFAPSNRNATISTSRMFEEIFKHRKDLVCKNNNASISYCKGQSSLYEVKGSRVQTVCDMIDFLDGFLGHKSINEFYEFIPESKYVRKYVEKNKQNMVEICSRKFEGTISPAYLKLCLHNVVRTYGKRAKKAKENNGIDYKAISHAFRGILGFKDLLRYGEIVFPLEYRNFIRDVKEGFLDYYKDGLDEKLDALIEEVENLVRISELREDFNQELLDNIILSNYSIKL